MEAIAGLQNGRWPVLVGEAGSGKSEQADAAAHALTGEKPTHLACSSKTSERDMVGIQALDQNGQSYLDYGPVMQAITGLNDSREHEPSHNGRIVRFDESGRLGDQGYATIKELRQLKPGSIFHGKKVLAGFSSIWTTNPTGPRYPDRADPDPAMRRELSYITVDYPPMSEDEPEIYEFLVANLLDENGHITAKYSEVAPGFKTLAVSGEEVVSDGRKIIGKEEIEPNRTDLSHGILYRLAFAIKTVEDAFVSGNGEIKDTALRYTVDQTGKIKIVQNGGEPLTLDTSTITLGEIASWMKGYKDRLLKDDANFQTDDLESWLQFKINLYLKQSDSEDRDKLRAIFEYFHLFDQSPAQNQDSKPLTPREIGYLSPRVKRPLCLEKPKVEEESFDFLVQNLLDNPNIPDSIKEKFASHA
jgi:hypothetical protein